MLQVNFTSWFLFEERMCFYCKYRVGSTLKDASFIFAPGLRVLAMVAYPEA